MDSKSFVYWVQGFIEIENPSQLDERQTQILKDHLRLVFDKETPNRNFDHNPGTSKINYCNPTMPEPTFIC